MRPSFISMDCTKGLCQKRQKQRPNRKAPNATYLSFIITGDTRQRFRPHALGKAWRRPLRSGLYSRRPLPIPVCRLKYFGRHLTRIRERPRVPYRARRLKFAWKVIHQNIAGDCAPHGAHKSKFEPR